MSKSKREPKISQHTEKMAGKYLFDTAEFDPSQGLDMRTRIKSEAMMNVLLFYGIMGEGLKSTIASDIKSIIERLLIAYEGGGRAEAVDVLRQNFPKRVVEDRGYEGLEALKERVKQAKDNP